MGETPSWAFCPNRPPCSHPALVHDIYDYDDPSPRCCMEGCDCGRDRTKIARGVSGDDQERQR